MKLEVTKEGLLDSRNGDDYKSLFRWIEYSDRRVKTEDGSYKWICYEKDITKQS